MKIHSRFYHQVMSFLFFSFFLFQLTAFGIDLVPVKYGGDENVDACMSYGKVDKIGNDQNEFLAVKDAPDLKAVRSDKLLLGQKLWVCGESKDGKWLGIVYPTNEKMDCGVTSPIADEKIYSGPCKSGWVSKKYVTILAE